MKKLLSLALALALCMGLSVPAMAEVESGPGWTYDHEANVLTLNGVKGECFSLETMEDGPQPTVVLAPGSKNELYWLCPWMIPTDYDKGTEKLAEITFKGSGELIIYTGDQGPDRIIDELIKERGICYGDLGGFNLEDGLTLTGGAKPGDSFPVSIEKFKAGGGYQYRCVVNNKPAYYIRVAPGATTSTPAATGFTDVPANSPFKDAINWAVKEGITKGLTDTTFGPSNTCTVSHILTFLWRAAGQPGDGVDDWAKSKGIDAPNLSAPCTRAMAVDFMWKAAGSPKPAKNASFSDVAASASYASAVSWAVEKGVTTGTSASTFAPDTNCTRGQIVTFLFRASK